MNIGCYFQVCLCICLLCCNAKKSPNFLQLPKNLLNPSWTRFPYSEQNCLSLAQRSELPEQRSFSDPPFSFCPSFARRRSLSLLPAFACRVVILRVFTLLSMRMSNDSVISRRSLRRRPGERKVNQGRVSRICHFLVDLHPIRSSGMM